MTCGLVVGFAFALALICSEEKIQRANSILLGEDETARKNEKGQKRKTP
jgi:hypothetical protein